MIPASEARDIANNSKTVHDTILKCLEHINKEVIEAAKAGLFQVECELHLTKLPEKLYNQVVSRLEKILLDIGYIAAVHSSSIVLKWGECNPKKDIKYYRTKDTDPAPKVEMCDEKHQKLIEKVGGNGPVTITQLDNNNVSVKWLDDSEGFLRWYGDDWYFLNGGPSDAATATGMYDRL